MKKENSGFGSLRKHEDLTLILLTVILVVFFSWLVGKLDRRLRSSER